MDLEYRGDADRRAELRAVGASSARIADVDIEPALFVAESEDVAFEDVRVRTQNITLRVLTSDVKKYGVKSGDPVIVKEGEFIIAEPPVDEEGITILALRKP